MNARRKIILYIAASLDGYISRKNGDVDWLFTDQDYGFGDFYKNIDTLLMGRKTYEQVLTFGEFPYKGKECYVFSRSLNYENDDVILINRDAVDFAREMKDKEGNDIWLVGGSGLIDVFVSNDLIDEYIISIHPVLLGNGIPLFQEHDSEIGLVLKDSVRFSSGLVQLHYERINR